MRVRYQTKLGALLPDHLDILMYIASEDDVGIQPQGSLVGREKLVRMRLDPSGDPRWIRVIIWRGSHLPYAIIVPRAIRETHVLDIGIDAIRKKQVVIFAEDGRVKDDSPAFRCRGTVDRN